MVYCEVLLAWWYKNKRPTEAESKINEYTTKNISPKTIPQKKAAPRKVLLSVNRIARL